MRRRVFSGLSETHTNVSQDLSSNVNPIDVGLTADPPLPPNWNVNMESTLMSNVPFKLFPVAAGTLEYASIVALMDPLSVNAVEQIVNPMLWTRFVNARKDLLLSKSNDLELLSTLLSNDREIVRASTSSVFEQHLKEVAACPYDDNVALLFHCTKRKENVDSILLEGLDERVGNGGTMGRGIYFASDPTKSMVYDGCGGIMFIFMVLLGDCLSVDRNGVKAFVREPNKQPHQQRNLNDTSFDSIVSQPLGACEYVVYNRYQCCPIYKIHYVRSTPIYNGTIYSQRKSTIPRFVWQTSAERAPSTGDGSWQFLAKNVFRDMGVQKIKPIDVTSEAKIEATSESVDNALIVLASLGFIDAELNLKVLKNRSYSIGRAIDDLLELNGGSSGALDERDILTNNKLATLISLGFTDAELNATILKKTSYDLNRCVDELLKASSGGDAAAAHSDYDNNGNNQHATETSNVAGRKPNGDTNYTEDCPICCNELGVSDAAWKLLSCGHKLCGKCFIEIETTRTTMNGAKHTFIRCPFCMKTSGVSVGLCPDGAMTTSIVSTPCQGYEGYQSIRIQYEIRSAGYQLNRIAYLPCNDEGNELLELLRIAWDRRICFTIGTSATSGQENVLVWNIHHKTAQNGGVNSHGYPDSEFMKRCRLELQAFGIE